jgi:hypothetical protein
MTVQLFIGVTGSSSQIGVKVNSYDYEFLRYCLPVGYFAERASPISLI